MSQPVPSAPDQPESAELEAQPVADDAEVEEEAPLNRADRRAKAKLNDPSHVGPRGANIKPGGRGPRSHSKRPI
ncbi:hypothetical protein [Pseudonocardia sp. GCM10023141]|uniref:hypothetical protein n=1 Tax=Pseudonocardia sp. GCM10023141 TaxID=3252653 RepID=UPI0036176CC5